MEKVRGWCSCCDNMNASLSVVSEKEGLGKFDPQRYTVDDHVPELAASLFEGLCKGSGKPPQQVFSE